MKIFVESADKINKSKILGMNAKESVGVAPRVE